MSNENFSLALDSITEMLSEVKELLKTKDNGLSVEDKKLLNRILASCNQSQSGIEKEEIEQFRTKISELNDTLGKPRIIQNRYSIDFSSSKTFFVMAFLFIGLFASLMWNSNQYKANRELADNDLKYRFIKMENGLDSAGIYKLESIFVYNRDHEIISKIKEIVKDYERRLKERAEELERARIKEEEAEKLLREAEGLKNR